MIAAIAAAEGNGAGDEVELWAENRDIVAAFVAISTQWRTAAGMGGLFYIGLDYTAARAGLELAGIDVTPALWSGIRIMEDEATLALNER